MSHYHFENCVAGCACLDVMSIDDTVIRTSTDIKCEALRLSPSCSSYLLHCLSSSSRVTPPCSTMLPTNASPSRLSRLRTCARRCGWWRSKSSRLNHGRALYGKFSPPSLPPSVLFSLSLNITYAHKHTRTHAQTYTHDDDFRF